MKECPKAQLYLRETCFFFIKKCPKAQLYWQENIFYTCEKIFYISGFYFMHICKYMCELNPNK